MPLRRWLTPLLGLLVLCMARAGAAEPDPAAADEQVLKTANLPADGPGLVEFLHRRTLSEADRPHLLALVRQLGDDDFTLREQASADLTAVGPTIVPLLREALKDPNLEIACRAQQCLIAIERAGRPAFLGAAIRTLARRKPAGAVEALLAFLPHIDDPEVLDDAVPALAVLGVRPGKVEAALVQALGDRSPVRRAVAGEVLARAGGGDVRPAVRRLLQDAEAGVRQRVALALLEMKDKDAVPALIGLLADAPRERVWRVEDALCRVAGDQAPAVGLGDDEDSRRKCRKAWDDWWKDNGAGVDLTKLDLSNHWLGYTLAAELAVPGGPGKPGVQGRVVEYDAAGRPRWQIDGLRVVMDAQMVGPDRVLLTEYTARVVTERNLKGEVLWQYSVAGPPLGARRLPNGNTFIVTRNQLFEVDKDGKEVVTIVRANSDVCAAAKRRDGGIVLLTNAGQLVHLDAAGQELKTLSPNCQTRPVGSNIDVLPNGHVLVPVYAQNKVLEIDEDGKTTWEAAVTSPSSVQRLPNGHTLVSSMLSQTVVELDRAGQEVRSLKTDGRIYRAMQR